MRKIVLYNTAVLSLNQGDHIIMESVKRHLAPVLQGNFVVEAPTHSPLFFPDQNNTPSFRQLKDFDLRFVGGTNLLAANRLHRQNTWNFRMCDAKCSANTVLVGVGSGPDAQKNINAYTQKFYDQVLSHRFAHSARDEATAELLRKMGFDAINTGCSTMWDLTKAHCAEIPTKRSDTVLFTVTDYAPDHEKDAQMLRILKKNYANVYAWIQGCDDKAYLDELDPGGDVQLVPPSLERLNHFLDETDCDYVGTRLHAGIKSMQKKKRSIIISIDNRARDMASTYQLNTLERDDISQLDSLINSSFATDVRIDEAAISGFMRQFDYLRKEYE